MFGIKLIHLENVALIELVLYPEGLGKGGKVADCCSEFFDIYGAKDYMLVELCVCLSQRPGISVTETRSASKLKCRSNTFQEPPISKSILSPKQGTSAE
jgi:hypothetical protein